LGLETPSCKSIPRYTLKGKDAESAKLLQAVHCADHLLGGLLDRMLPTLPQDTVVIVQSDHLQTPRADVFPLLGAPSTRDNLFLAWGSDHAPGVVSRQATMFDVAPTFLSLLNRKPVALNLGRDLLSPEPTLVETHGMPWLEQRMLAAMTDHRMGEANFVEHQRDKEADARMRGERSRPRPFGDPHLGKQLPSETVPASKKIQQSTPVSQ
jgi:phosphoglycerol transferase MdoB-like AlkP superfamily enzyme